MNYLKMNALRFSCVDPQLMMMILDIIGPNLKSSLTSFFLNNQPFLGSILRGIQDLLRGVLNIAQHQTVVEPRDLLAILIGL